MKHVTPPQVSRFHRWKYRPWFAIHLGPFKQAWAWSVSIPGPPHQLLAVGIAPHTKMPGRISPTKEQQILELEQQNSILKKDLKDASYERCL